MTFRRFRVSTSANPLLGRNRRVVSSECRTVVSAKLAPTSGCKYLISRKKRVYLNDQCTRPEDDLSSCFAAYSRVRQQSKRLARLFFNQFNSLLAWLP